MSAQDDQPTSGNGGRISVSEDRLVRVVLESEIRLRDFLEKLLESKADLIMLNEARRDVSSLKEQDEKFEARLSSLERWRYGLAAVVALLVFTIPVGALLLSPHL